MLSLEESLEVSAEEAPVDRADELSSAVVVRAALDPEASSLLAGVLVGEV